MNDCRSSGTLTKAVLSLPAVGRQKGPTASQSLRESCIMHSRSACCGGLNYSHGQRHYSPSTGAEPLCSSLNSRGGGRHIGWGCMAPCNSYRMLSYFHSILKIVSPINMRPTFSATSDLKLWSLTGVHLRNNQPALIQSQSKICGSHL